LKESQLFGYEMSRVSEVYFSTLSAKMKPYGLERNFKLFLQIAENDCELNQAELAECTRRDKVSTMRSIDYLEEQKLIERRKDQVDRRCQRMALTEKGRTTIPVLKNAILETNQLLFGYLTKGDYKALSRSMLSIMEHLKNLPTPDYIVKPHKRNK